MATDIHGYRMIGVGIAKQTTAKPSVRSEVDQRTVAEKAQSAGVFEALRKYCVKEERCN
jgi:hypothetical protein